MYTTEYGLAGTTIALLSLLCVPLYTHLRTPIVTWTRPVLDNNVGALAKRVVLIVSDGLRSDISLDKLANGLDYKHIIKATSWVEPPTESRPAHGQMLCGVAEDPQALFERWTRFPRSPDNVLRNAPFAFAIGAPDVVPFFGGRNVHMETFPKYKEAAEYAQGAALNIVKAIDEYYKDKETVYIFASDHGFGSGRSHDQAERTSRRTPLWIFGKGVNETITLNDRYPTKHKDLSVLISLLAGNPLPTDSTGIVPLHLMPQASDSFKANSILLACQSSLIRMRMVYEQWIEKGDRLLNWSSTRRDIETMSKNFEQLQLIIENKPELAKDVVNMSMAAHRDILSKTDSLLYRNAGIAIGLALATLLMSVIMMWTVAYQNIKGSGESGAFSFVAMLVAAVVSGGLAMRGVEWPYYVWCWATALVFSWNGAVMAIDVQQIAKRGDNVAVWVIVVLSSLTLFYHPLHIVGLTAFSLYTIMVCRREQKRAVYGLLAIIMTLVLTILPFAAAINISTPEIIDVAIKSSVILAAAALTKASFGDLTIAQVAFAFIVTAANYFHFSSIIRVVVVLSMICHILDSNTVTTMKWFWTAMTLTLSFGTLGNLVTLLALSSAAVLLVKVHLQEQLGEAKFEPFLKSITSSFSMSAFIANGALSTLFSPTTIHTRNLWDSPGFGAVIAGLMTALPSLVVISAIKSGHYKNYNNDKYHEDHDDSQFRLVAAMMLPFALSALFGLMTMTARESTWRQVGESIGRFEFSVIAASLVFLTGYL